MSVNGMLRPSSRELNKHGLLVICRVDAYNNSVSGYIWVTYDNQGNEVKAGQMTPEQTATIAQAGGI